MLVCKSDLELGNWTSQGLNGGASGVAGLIPRRRGSRQNPGVVDVDKHHAVDDCAPRDASEAPPLSKPGGTGAGAAEGKSCETSSL